MFIRLQALGALLLLLLASALGNAGFARCLCTGKLALPAQADTTCETCCCHGEVEEHGAENDIDDPVVPPCEDGSCWVVVSFDSIEPPKVSSTKTAPPAPAPLPHAEVDLPTPLNRVAPPPRTDHPPGSGSVALTVLYSSYLL